jgi:hypothetical protein
MKKLLFLPLLACFLLMSFEGTIKSPRSWWVGETKIDPKLSKTQAAFTINFNEYGIPITQKILFSVDGKTDTLQPDKAGNYDLRVKPGKHIFQFYLDANHYEIKTDSIVIAGGYRTPLTINFTSAQTEVICDKPVIYVYPQESQEVSIRLDLKGEIGFTYPYYNIGWNFTADPDGTIHMNDKKYHYLFWDGKTEIDNTSIDWNEGFIVERDSLVPFFEEKLKLMGLNSKEAEDYITYWCPRMVANEKNYIHFMFNEEYNEYAGLEVSPAPDKMFRVFMLWTKAEENKNAQVIPQVIESFEREGFTVVEWGGAEMPRVPVIFDLQASN